MKKLAAALFCLLFSVNALSADDDYLKVAIVENMYSEAIKTSKYCENDLGCYYFEGRTIFKYANKDLQNAIAIADFNAMSMPGSPFPQSVCFVQTNITNLLDANGIGIEEIDDYYVDITDSGLVKATTYYGNSEENKFFKVSCINDVCRIDDIVTEDGISQIEQAEKYCRKPFSL